MLRSVMVIDDNPADRLWTKMMFEKSQRYSEIILVNNAIDALAAFQERDVSKKKWGAAFPPDLIVLDVNMPRVDGFEFLERLKTLLAHQQKQCPQIVMWVDDADTRTRQRALEHDVVFDTLAKPLTVQSASNLADIIPSSKS